MAALTTSIRIPAGTIVFHHWNGPKGIEERTVTLIADVYVEASRLEDGRWGYAVGRNVYSCAGGSAC